LRSCSYRCRCLGYWLTHAVRAVHAADGSPAQRATVGMRYAVCAAVAYHTAVACSTRSTGQVLPLCTRFGSRLPRFAWLPLVLCGTILVVHFAAPLPRAAYPSTGSHHLPITSSRSPLILPAIYITVCAGSSRRRALPQQPTVRTCACRFAACATLMPPILFCLRCVLVWFVRR